VRVLGSLTVDGGISGALAFNLTTNDFALNTYYTNGATMAHISTVVRLTKTGGAGQTANVSLYIDEDGDGSFEWPMAGAAFTPEGGGSGYIQQQLSAMIPAGARFVFTNTSFTAGDATIRPRSSRWVNF
jgi:hypothetical protein